MYLFNELGKRPFILCAEELQEGHGINCCRFSSKLTPEAIGSVAHSSQSGILYFCDQDLVSYCVLVALAPRQYDTEELDTSPIDL